MKPEAGLGTAASHCCCSVKPEVNDTNACTPMQQGPKLCLRIPARKRCPHPLPVYIHTPDCTSPSKGLFPSECSSSSPLVPCLPTAPQPLPPPPPRGAFVGSPSSALAQRVAADLRGDLGLECQSWRQYQRALASQARKPQKRPCSPLAEKEEKEEEGFSVAVGAAAGETTLSPSDTISGRSGTLPVSDYAAKVAELRQMQAALASSRATPNSRAASRGTLGGPG
eukprot:RCo042107